MLFDPLCASTFLPPGKRAIQEAIFKPLDEKVSPQNQVPLGIDHHVDKDHHILATGKQTSGLHGTHKVHQTIRRPQKYVDSCAIHRVLHQLFAEKMKTHTN